MIFSLKGRIKENVFCNAHGHFPPLKCKTKQNRILLKRISWILLTGLHTNAFLKTKIKFALILF